MTELANNRLRQDPKPTAWKALVFFLFVLCLGAVLAVFIWTQRSQDGPKIVSEAPLPLMVNVVDLTLQPSVEFNEKFTGLVNARRSSGLGFTTGGMVQQLNADIGDTVRQGQVLGQLDKSGLMARRNTARASLAEVRAAYELSALTVERQIALAERGHVSPQAIDTARSAEQVAAARIEAAAARLDALNVELRFAELKAPFNGVITARYLDEGAIATPGQMVFQIVESDQLEARIGLTLELARTLEIGRSYQLQVGTSTVMARLRAINGVVEARERTVICVFDVVDGAMVSAGQIASIQLPQLIMESGAWLPVSALAEIERGLWSVYIVRPQGDAWIVDPGVVEIVHAEGDRVYVRGGFRDGDMAVIDGLQRISPGQSVTPSTGSSFSANASDGTIIGEQG